MTALDIASTVLVATGATAILASRPAFSSLSLVTRLAPYAPGGTPVERRRVGVRTAWLAVLSSMGRSMDRLTTLLGVKDDLASRLRRVHSPMTVSDFRSRQVAVATATAVFASLFVAAVGLSTSGLALAAVAPILAALLVEERLIAASDRWRRAVAADLPTIADQLSLLVGGGYSIAAALDRLQGRHQGACALDLRRVVARTRHGLTPDEALTEWAGMARVDGVRRVVRVLVDQRFTPDLERLLAAEASALRRAAHRDLIAHLERRNQQVWIPVTVAALVPGSIFIAIPFIHALHAFSAS